MRWIGSAALMVALSGLVWALSWGTPGSTVGMSATAAQNHMASTGKADPYRNYFTPTGFGYSASSYYTGVSNTSFLNKYSAIHDYNVHSGRLSGVIGYLDIFTPLLGLTHNELFPSVSQTSAIISNPNAMYFAYLTSQSTPYFDSKRVSRALTGYDEGYQAGTTSVYLQPSNNPLFCALRWAGSPNPSIYTLYTRAPNSPGCFSGVFTQFRYVCHVQIIGTSVKCVN